MTYPTGLLPLSPPLSPLTMNTTINQWLQALKTCWVGPTEPPAILIEDGMLWLDTSTASPRLKFRMLGDWIRLLSSVGETIVDCDDALFDGTTRVGPATLNSPFFGFAGSMITAARAGAHTQLAFRQDSTEHDLAWIRCSLDAAGTSWRPWRRVFTQADIVGTVSVALGVPSGGVMESGVNSNGAYLRLADGTQFCFHSELINFDAVGSLGSTWIFPKPFATNGWRASVVISDLSITPAVSQLGQIVLSANTATSVDVSLYRAFGQTNFGSGDTAHIHMTVMGKWL